MLNVDKLKLFPNQNAENRPTECVGETVADIIANIIGTPMDAGFSYAMTLRLAGATPTTGGTNPFIGMQTGFFYGALPIIFQDFNAVEKGELYEANWQNFSAEDISAAVSFAMKGIITLETFDDIVAYLNKYKWPVSLTMKWYNSFGIAGYGNVVTPNPDGSNRITGGGHKNAILSNPGGVFTSHNVEVCGIADDGTLVLKPWLGPEFGDGGYCYLTREMFAATQYGWLSYGYDPDAIRLLSILQVAFTRLHLPMGDLFTLFKAWKKS